MRLSLALVLKPGETREYGHPACISKDAEESVSSGDGQAANERR